MLSKYTSFIKLKKDLYAVYNNLVCIPVFITKKEKELLIDENFDEFSKKDVEKLYQLGILVRDVMDDRNVIDLVKETVEKNLRNKIYIMYIIPTNACNLACTYCFIGKTACGQNIKIIESKTIIAAIDKYNSHLRSVGLSKGEIIFYGGEPTLCWNKIIEAKKHIINNKYPIDVSIVTNGSTLNECKIEEIEKYDIGLGISIDGPKNITDKNRFFKFDEKSVYDTVLKGIDLVKNKGIPFSLSVTLSEYFVENQDDALEWLINLKVPSINFNLMRFNNNLVDWKSYYIKASNFLIKAYEKLKGNNIQDDRVQRKVEAFYCRQFKFSDCAAMGANQLTIRPNGDVCICHGYWNGERDSCGNINQNDFDEIMNSQSYLEWANNISINKKKCKNCKYIFVCGGGCAQQSEVLFGGRKYVDKSFCVYTKTVFRWLLLKHYYANGDYLQFTK